MRSIPLIVAALVLVGSSASAQTVPASASAAQQAAVPGPQDDAKTWAFTASAYGYFVPDPDDYVQPAFTADRDWLHLEARYNYEDRETASVWLGRNFGGGESVSWEVTPMVGGVFGNTAGVAPGYRFSLGWRAVEIYSEGEVVIDTGEASDSFFYNWSEASLAAADWFRFGLVTQRTRAYQTARDIQRGLLVGLTFGALSVTGYVFNPDDEKPTVVLSAAVTF